MQEMQFGFSDPLKRSEPEGSDYEYKKHRVCFYRKIYRRFISLGKSSLRLLIPIIRKISFMCSFTVFSLIKRLSAISLFESPFANKTATSSFLGVNGYGLSFPFTNLSFINVIL